MRYNLIIWILGIALGILIAQYRVVENNLDTVIEQAESAPTDTTNFATIDNEEYK